ncbi:MAG: DUF1549 domain-containing protein [Acidobacteria bacterium]|nr:DUF1549 domain-containing protein [Acidobacteriota bacterium]
MRWLALLVLVPGAVSADFEREVRPILAAKCAACHSGEAPQGGLSLETPAAIFQGGLNGPAMVPGSSRESLLIQRASGFRPPTMPTTGDHLSERELGILRDWIDQARPLVSDEVFVRRAYLDLWGLLPAPEECEKFLRDSMPNKRARLIDRLLAHNRNYAEHWTSFWNDLLRNDEGVIYHGARQSITPWLLKALEDNLPYDEFVRDLLNPQGKDGPEGFLIGVNWRGTVSASQTPPLQAAQNSAQVFLGVNLKCNSCHDSFISHWKLKDAYGLASFFSEEELEIYRCDVKTGEKSRPKFLFPEPGGTEVSGSLAERRAAAARLFTAPENTRFARTVVNRYWKRLLGKGLVEPVDDMDGKPSDPALLEWLAADFAGHGYDLKHLLRRILNSEAYQRPSVRRMTAEQYADAISSITGEWRVLQPSKAGLGAYAREWRLKSSPLTRALGRPIRDQVFTDRNSEATTLQALELVNGETLSTLVHRGAKRMLGELKPPPANLFDSGDVRSNKAPVDIDISGAKELRLLIEDSDSYDRARVVAGWAKAELAGPGGAAPLEGLERLPIPSEKIYPLDGKGYTRFRAVAGVDPGCLKSDINPRVRFFVFTEEPDRRHLVRVAETTQVPVSRDPDELIPRLWRHALARGPTPEERRVAIEFWDGTSEGLEDLLWSIFLSPEFQLIH